MHADIPVVLQMLDELLHLFYVVVSTGLKGLAEDERPQRHASVVDPQLKVDATEEHRRDADKGATDLCLDDHWPQCLREALDLRRMLRAFPAFRLLRPSRVVSCKKPAHRVDIFNASLVNASRGPRRTVRSCVSLFATRAITNYLQLRPGALCTIGRRPRAASPRSPARARDSAEMLEG